LRSQIKKEMTKVLPKEISDLANQEGPEIDVRRRHKVGGVENNLPSQADSIKSNKKQMETDNCF
jgi:hypothetical protein